MVSANAADARAIKDWMMSPDFLQALFTYVVTLGIYLSSVSQFFVSTNNSPNLEEADGLFIFYDEMVRLYPEDPKLYAQRGFLRLERKEFDNAVADFETAMRLAPDAAPPYYLRARAWHLQKQFDQAVADYSEAIRRDPGDFRSYSYRGLLYEEQKDLYLALFDYNRAIEIAPDVSEILVCRARIYAELKEFEQSLDDFNEAICLDPQNNNAYANRGFCWVKQENFDEAICDYDKAVELSPPMAKPFNNRGHGWLGKGEYERAISDFIEAILIQPDDPNHYLSRARAWAALQRWDEAIADMNQCIDLKPDDTELLLTRSHAHMLNRDLVAAIADVDRAIQIAPHQSSLYVRRAWCQQKLLKFSECISDCTEAIRRDPNDAIAYFNRGAAQANQKNYLGALPDYLAADELDARQVPWIQLERLARHVMIVANQTIEDQSDEIVDPVEIAAAYHDRGLANQILGIDDQAIIDFSLAMGMDQTSATHVAARGKLFLQKRDSDRALADFDQAIRLNPDSAIVWRLRGMLFLEQEQWKKACEDLSESLRLEPGHYRTLARRGIARHALKQWDLAIADLDLALSGNPFLIRLPRSQWAEKASPPQTNRHNNDSGASKESKLDDEPNLLPNYFSGTNSEPDQVDAVRTAIGSALGVTSSSTTTPNGGSNQGSANRDLSWLDQAQGTNGQNQTSNNLSNSLSASSTCELSPSDHIQNDPIYLAAFRCRAECREARAEWGKALMDYRELTRLQPGDSYAYRKIAWINASCVDVRYRDGHEAVKFAKRAIAKAKSRQPIDLATLAAAYAELDDFQMAVQSLIEAYESEKDDLEKQFVVRRLHFKSIEFSRALEDDNPNSVADHSQVIAAAIEACEKSMWKDAILIEKLADAYADAGQFDQAESHQEKVLGLKLELCEKSFQERFGRYRPGRSYRDEKLVRPNETASSASSGNDSQMPEPSFGQFRSD